MQYLEVLYPPPSPTRTGFYPYKILRSVLESHAEVTNSGRTQVSLAVGFRGGNVVGVLLGGGGTHTPAMPPHMTAQHRLCWWLYVPTHKRNFRVTW